MTQTNANPDKTKVGSLTLRDFEASDADTVKSMISDLASLHGDAATITVEDLLRFCLGPQKLSRALVADVGGNPVGLVVTYDWANLVHGFTSRIIDLLVVRDGFRRSGIGEAIVRDVVKTAVSDGCRRVSVESARNNAVAISFYARIGFDPTHNGNVKLRLEGEGMNALANGLSP